jgi:hypothetical protein
MRCLQIFASWAFLRWSYSLIHWGRGEMCILFVVVHILYTYYMLLLGSINSLIGHVLAFARRDGRQPLTHKAVSFHVAI